MPQNPTPQVYQDETDRLADEFARKARRDILKPDRGLSVFEALAQRPWRRPPFDRAKRTADLARAEQHVRDGERHIESQNRVIATLQAVGADLTLARQVLSTFEELQATHIDDRDRIAAELALA